MQSPLTAAVGSLQGLLEMQAERDHSKEFCVFLHFGVDSRAESWKLEQRGYNHADVPLLPCAFVRWLIARAVPMPGRAGVDAA